MAVQKTEQANYRRSRPAVKAARAKARDLAQRWAIDELADDLESAVGELMANAVVHGRAARGSRVTITYLLHSERLRVEVRDHATGTPHLIHTGSLGSDIHEDGRGLAIVAALSHRWGVIHRVIGKSVWFEIKLASPVTRAHPSEETS